MSNSSIGTVREDAKQLFREARPWIKTLARFGYAAKGVVYVLIGMIAMMVALGRRGQPADFSGVLIQVVRQPFGSLLLALLTIGLACYGLWCLVQAVMDTENKGTSFFCDFDTHVICRSRLRLPRFSVVGVSAPHEDRWRQTRRSA